MPKYVCLLYILPPDGKILILIRELACARQSDLCICSSFSLQDAETIVFVPIFLNFGKSEHFPGR